MQTSVRNDLPARLARLRRSELLALAEENGLKPFWRNAPGGRRQAHSTPWLVERLLSLAATGRDLGLD